MFVYLILTILFGSAFGLCIKWVQIRKTEDVYTVGAINYISGFLLSLPLFLGWLNFGPESSVLVDADLDEHGPFFDAQWFEFQWLSIRWTGGQTIAALCGATMGLCYFIAYFFVSYAIKTVGVAATAVVGTLSMMVPITFGIFIWHESPNSWQAIGILLAIFALTLVGTRSASSDQPLKFNWITPIVLGSFFAMAGISRLAQEAFKHESLPEYRSTYLFAAFLIATIPSIVMLAWRRRWPSLAEIGLGFLMGGANISQTQFVLLSLKSFDGFIVFPVVSAGGILLTTFVAWYWLQEVVDRRTTLGVGLAIVALVLLQAGQQIQNFVGNLFA